ncbi:PREDICTED: BPI fold-containing family A member 2 [Myotis brandtii]|uniref:BPI fold-containing family A member 2 n=1 Tax=Myotis brandtii TaxID=109478 RepID=UPI0007047BC0|nr:PREDICTED: BPI fold-containing family A member 2 [Myotis brandtii]XP_014383528.1 PREDICTED: BPI fold-containing family A member 2 [Myotis brandtii]
MFQLWKLVLLCGLISGTSAGILQKLKEDLSLLQETKGWQTIKAKIHQNINLLNDALSKIFKGGHALGLKICNVRILNFKAEPTPDGQGLRLRFPTSADVTFTLPLVGKAVHLNVSLDLLATIQVETDPKSGDSRVVMTDCVSDPDSISFTLLGEHSTLVNKLSGTISSYLSDTVSFLVQNHMCPLLRIFVSTLSPQFVENIIKNGQPVANVPVNA